MSQPSQSAVTPTLSPSASRSGLTPRQREKAPRLEDVALPPGADREIILLMADYLAHRHPRLAETLAAEIGPTRDEAVKLEIDAVEKAILDGNFSALEGLLASPGLLGVQTQKAFLYMCYRQQFLEYIDNRESQKAFNLLQKRLKPLEHYQPVPYDFYSLAYLTSASTVHDAPGLRDWAGAVPERERLVSMWRELTDNVRTNAHAVSGDVSPRRPVPRDRLVTLLRQATAWQVDTARVRGSGPWVVQSLLTDYASPSVPTRLERLVRGHRANIKCVAFLADGLGISGSSDATLRIFNTVTGETEKVLQGHQSRVWDVSTSHETASYIASASGDGTVRIWTPDGECASVLVGDGGDVYSVRWQPGREDRVVAACYDKILRLWDVEADRLIRTFSGHAQSTLAVCFDPTGKVIASGSKDKHIRLWDAVGGVCTQTMTSHLGEITSVEFDHDGKYLLAGCKDNSIRLWDLRMQRNIYRYTGHQNTSKNIIRCSFATASSSLIASGSEDGLVYLWEREGSETDSSTTSGFSGTSSPAAVSSPPPISGISSPPTLGFASPPYQPAGITPSSLLGNINPTRASTLTSPNILGNIHPARAPTLPRGPSTHTGGFQSPSEKMFPSAGGLGTGGLGSGGRWGGSVPNPITAPGATTVRPFKALAGHGAGAVFDVAARSGILLSGGEDGAVGVWDGE